MGANSAINYEASAERRDPSTPENDTVMFSHNFTRRGKYLFFCPKWSIIPRRWVTRKSQCNIQSTKIKESLFFSMTGQKLKRELSSNDISSMPTQCTCYGIPQEDQNIRTLPWWADLLCRVVKSAWPESARQPEAEGNRPAATATQEHEEDDLYNVNYQLVPLLILSMSRCMTYAGRLCWWCLTQILRQ
jgi:hypothetical protein